MRVVLVKYRWKYDSDGWNIAGICEEHVVNDFVKQFKEQFISEIRDSLRFETEIYILNEVY